ncbi:MAG: hypothetical protein ACT60Q_19020 [Ferrovibrionaceae bacterium]
MNQKSSDQQTRLYHMFENLFRQANTPAIGPRLGWVDTVAEPKRL